MRKFQPYHACKGTLEYFWTRCICQRRVGKLSATPWKPFLALAVVRHVHCFQLYIVTLCFLFYNRSNVIINFPTCTLQSEHFGWQWDFQINYSHLSIWQTRFYVTDPLYFIILYSILWSLEIKHVPQSGPSDHVGLFDNKIKIAS